MTTEALAPLAMMSMSAEPGVQNAIIHVSNRARTQSPCRRQGSTNLKTGLLLGWMLITMKNASTPLMLLALLLASLSPVLVQDIEFGDSIKPSETAGRDLIDLTIVDISIGNTTQPSETWTQSDGSMIDYILRGNRYETSITFKNAGTGFSDVDAIGVLEAVHPIGFVIESWSFNLSLAGGQQDVQIVEWTPEAAHSIVDNGDLHGGVIFRGTISTMVAGLGDDPSNNLYEEQIPIAVWKDPLEGTFAADTPMWYAVPYTSRNPTSLYGGGTDWNTDNSSAAEGTKHWRVSEGGSYTSNTIDMLKFGWVPTSGSCNDPGHGLGYGMYDSDAEAIYGLPFCWLTILDSDFRSIHWATKVWGSMGAGDEMAMEAVRSMNTIKELNLTQAGVSPAQNDWTQIVWNMTDVHDDQGYTLSYSKIADNSGANEGMHIDDFVLFGVDVVDEYTISLDCDDPSPNSYVVIPADPNPPSLFCHLTNNGYREVNLAIYTEVSNQSWMNTYPLRIDSDNMLDHDNYVTLNPLDGETTTSFWVNLTIPEGSNVETVNWTLSFSDIANSEVMSNLNLAVSVSSSYSVRLDQVSPSYPALTLEPGHVGEIALKVKNTGNQQAQWSPGAYFSDSLWGSSNLQWFEDWDEDGNLSALNQFSLDKGEERPIVARFTAPSQNEPGLVEISLYVQGVAPANAQSVEKIFIEIPTIQGATVTPYDSSMSALADGNMRTMLITIQNDGNAPEIFDLSINADWRIGASLVSQSTEPVSPFGGFTEITVVMEMPQGLSPNFYPITVTATSQTDSTYSASGTYTLEVPSTYIVEVEEKDLSGQSFSAGTEPRTMNFEIFNHGNELDAFDIDLTMDVGVIAQITSGAIDGRTTYIDPQTSTNVTISYSFTDGTEGMRELVVTATSVESGNAVSSSGSADFQVGTLGWIRLEALDLTNGAGESIESISESGTHRIMFEVLNQHPSDPQEIRLSVSTDDEAVWNLKSIRVSSSDQQFELSPGDKRNVFVEVEVTEQNLVSLDEETMVFTVTLKVEATDDNTQISKDFSAERYVPSGSGDSSKDLSALLKNVAIWGFSSILIIALLVVLAKIVMSTEHDDEISSLGGYESNLGLPEAPTIPDAPTLPSADTTANSMYGGTQELFAQPVMQTPPPPVEEPPAPAPVADVQTGPQLPESGLPEGWTMEQWTHYGAEYLRRQGGS